MKYRKANRDDIGAIVENRMVFVTSIRSLENTEDFKARTRAYLETHIERNDLSVWMAEDGGELAAICLTCFYETAPRPSCPSGKCAELLNVFTHPHYRRQGHAEKLLRLMIAEAGERGVNKITLEATEDGCPLYKKLGFEELNCQLALRL